MKRIAALSLSMLLLAGCGPATTPTPSTEPAKTAEELGLSAPYVLYLPDDQAQMLEPQVAELSELNAQAVIDALIQWDALPQGVKVNYFVLDGTPTTGYEEYTYADLGYEFDPAQFGNIGVLDLSGEFGQAVTSTGTAGEAMLMGAVANSFLDAYHCLLDSLLITVDGKIIETGHAVYDVPMAFHPINTDFSGYIRKDGGETMEIDDAELIWAWDAERREERAEALGTAAFEQGYEILNSCGTTGSLPVADHKLWGYRSDETHALVCPGEVGLPLHEVPSVEQPIFAQFYVVDGEILRTYCWAAL